MTALAFAPEDLRSRAHQSAQSTQSALFMVSDQPAAHPAAQLTPARPAPAAQYRLTRRGRLAVFGSTLAAFAVLFVALGAQAVATFQDPVSVETVSVAVMPGMTLWEIAAQANPGGDIRATIDDIIRLNALPVGGSLPIGTQLEVPVYAG